MQEKSTKPFQQKLDTLTELPDGFSFDAADSWNKLEKTLNGKPAERKRAWWYYAAAACFIVVAALMYMRNLNSENLVVTVLPKQNPQPTAEVKTPAVAFKKEKSVITKVPAIKNKVEKQQTVIKAPSIEHPSVTEVVIEETKSPVISTETATFETPITPVPAKRKIVHFNELIQEQQLEHQRMAEVKRNQQITEEVIPVENPLESGKPRYKKTRTASLIKNQ